MATQLDGCRGKVARAKKHLAELEASIAGGLNDQYGIFDEVDADTGEHVRRVKMPKELLTTWGLITGDVVHELRSSLDHLAGALVRVNDAAPTRRTEFPVWSDRLEYPKASRRQVAGMSERARTVIERLQPYNVEPHERHWLWLLHELWNRDKHQVITVIALTIPEARIAIGGSGPYLISKAAFFADGIGGGIAQDGAELSRIKVVGDVHVNEHVRLEVAFDRAGPASGRALVPTLQDLVLDVETTLKDFEPFFK